MSNIPKLCTNCGAAMSFVKHEQVQLGRTSFLFGDWPNLIAGALAVEIWCCPDCGKIDFYRGESAVDAEYAENEGDRIAQVTCSACGIKYDLDYPKCPYCGAKNPSF